MVAHRVDLRRITADAVAAVKGRTVAPALRLLAHAEGLLRRLRCRRHGKRQLEQVGAESLCSKRVSKGREGVAVAAIQLLIRPQVR